MQKHFALLMMSRVGEGLKMPKPVWQTKDGSICSTEAEAIALEKREQEHQRITEFLAEYWVADHDDSFYDIGSFVISLEESEDALLFLKACLTRAATHNPEFEAVFGSEFASML